MGQSSFGTTTLNFRKNAHRHTHPALCGQCLPWLVGFHCTKLGSDRVPMKNYKASSDQQQETSITPTKNNIGEKQQMTFMKRLFITHSQMVGIILVYMT